MSEKVKTTLENEPQIDAIRCIECDAAVDTDDVYYCDEEPYCEQCCQRYIVTCERCGNDIHTSNSIHDDYTTLCADCYDSHYTRCNECNSIIHNDSAFYFNDNETPYCEDCYNDAEGEEDDCFLHEYSYKPDPIFYGDDSDRYFGVELEIDYGGQSRTNAERITNLANTSDTYIYIKTDGSLSEGLEIVTHPMTLQYHISKMPWLDIMNKALNMDYRSHKTDTCGLHIHLNRSYLSEYHDEQDKYISRILYFVEHHWEEMLRFSRRTEEQIQRWAKRYGLKSTDRPNDVLYNAKSANIGRYAAVNITNYDTIEFRLFRGTLRYNTLIATLQMVDAICDVAISFSDNELAQMSWSQFVSGLRYGKYPELITYLKERRLYVNEPVEAEEDL